VKEETLEDKGGVFERKQVRRGQTHLGLSIGKWPKRGFVTKVLTNFEEEDEREEELTGNLSAHDMFDNLLK
jgi:hypothetical protein